MREKRIERREQRKKRLFMFKEDMRRTIFRPMPLQTFSESGPTSSVLRHIQHVQNSRSCRDIARLYYYIQRTLSKIYNTHLNMNIYPYINRDTNSTPHTHTHTYIHAPTPRHNNTTKTLQLILHMREIYHIELSKRSFKKSAL